jgi:hypothetical protein
MVGVIRDKLTELAPEHAADFARNHDAFVAELDALDRDLHALLDPLPNRRFMVFHPAWGYFADTYGLTQVPIEREGKEPGARGLAALIDQAKADGSRWSSCSRSSTSNRRAGGTGDRRRRDRRRPAGRGLCRQPAPGRARVRAGAQALSPVIDIAR